MGIERILFSKLTLHIFYCVYILLLNFKSLGTLFLNSIPYSSFYPHIILFAYDGSLVLFHTLATINQMLQDSVLTSFTSCLFHFDLDKDQNDDDRKIL